MDHAQYRGKRSDTKILVHYICLGLTRDAPLGTTHGDVGTRRDSNGYDRELVTHNLWPFMYSVTVFGVPLVPHGQPTTRKMPWEYHTPKRMLDGHPMDRPNAHLRVVGSSWGFSMAYP